MKLKGESILFVALLELLPVARVSRYTTASCLPEKRSKNSASVFAGLYHSSHNYEVAIWMNSDLGRVLLTIFQNKTMSNRLSGIQCHSLLNIVISINLLEIKYFGGIRDL